MEKRRTRHKKQDLKFVQLHHNLHLLKIACFVVIRQKRKRGYDVVCVRTLDFQSFVTAICEVLPVIHDINGCDKTFKFFGIGKGKGSAFVTIIQCYL